jgi:hypothetical protein
VVGCADEGEVVGSGDEAVDVGGAQQALHLFATGDEENVDYLADMTEPQQIGVHPVHLASGGRAYGLPAFDGSMDWYGAYEEATAADGADGRLLTVHTFDESWTSWEMHPVGHEVVLCIDGEVTLIQEIDGESQPTLVHAGEWIINAPGVWHTADVGAGARCTCVFITPGMGTQTRER